MTPTEYIRDCVRTNTQEKYSVASDLLHASMGIVTEGGELMDQLKKHKFYGKKLDLVNIKEEVGDLLWYISILLAHMGWTYEEVMELNIQKLRARYKDTFSHEEAVNRNLEVERIILESNERNTL